MSSATNISTALVTAAKTVEIRSRWSPPYKLNTSDLTSGPSGPWMPILQPAVILDGGIIGQQVIAPNGLPDPDDWKRNLVFAGGAAALLLAGGAALIFGFGVRVGHRQARRKRES